MRNLKRALSLALAMVMVLSMMVVGAGAVSLDDFSDKDKIVNDEAVIVLTTLGVINGKDDGTYDPEGIVTRAEMAKMICVILNGGKDPQLGETLKNTYTDTVGHWAAPYIEYCTTLGIVAGKGDGTFDPNGTVTVAEAGKMLLVALGYNASVEGYVGGNWQINTDVRANQLDIYDGLNTLNTNVDLTRDNAAQMCYNALDVNMVEYSYVITGTNDNSISTKPQLNDRAKGTLLWEKFGAIKLVGEVIANEFANLNATKTDTDKAPASTVIGTSLDAGKTEILVTNYDDGQTSYRNANFTFSVSTGEEELGKAVWMYVKPSTTSLKSTVIGSAIISDDNRIVTDASGDSAKDVSDDNNLDLVAGETRYAYNYSGMSTTAPAGKDGMVGIQKTLVDTDGDGDVNYVLYKEMGIGKVTLYTEAKDGQIVVAVNGGNYINKDKDDIIGFENVEKDDFVLTAYFGGRLYVQEPETVTGKIDAYKQTEVRSNNVVTGYRNTGFTVDGQAYTVSRVHTYAGNDLTAAVTEVDKTILSSEATFYCDLNGYVVAYGEVDESAYKYAYVWGAEAGSRINTDKVKVTTEDGTTKTYELDSNSDIDIDTADNLSASPRKIDEKTMQGQVYAYTLTSSGNIKLYLPKGGAVQGIDHPAFTKGLTAVKFDDNAAKVNELTPSSVTPVEGKTYYSNNSTTFFYVTTENKSDPTSAVKKVTVYNGRNSAPTLTGNDGEALLALNNKGDVGSAVFTNVSVTESAGDHMFVYNSNYVWDEYGYVNAFLNGETAAQENLRAALYVDNEIVHNPTVRDGIYLYKMDSKGYYELTRPTNESYYFTGVVSRVNKANNTFVIEKSGQFVQEFRLTSESVVIDYDTSHTSPIAYTNGSISVGDEVQVIVNNADDSQVLMAAIMERNQIINGGGGVVVGWDVPAPSTTLTNLATIEDIHAAFKAGNNVIINGDWNNQYDSGVANLAIPSGFVLRIDGDMNAAGGSDKLGLINNAGTLMVRGKLTTDGAQTTLTGTIKATNLDLTVTGNIAVNADITVVNDINTSAGNQKITVGTGKNVVAGGDIDLDNNNVDNYGHIEWGTGKTFTAGHVNDYSPNSLTGGALNVTGLTLGGTVGSTTYTGNLNVTALDANGGPVTVAKGSSYQVTGNTQAGAMTTADGSNVTMGGNLTVAADSTLNGNVTISGALNAGANDITVNTGSLTVGGTITAAEVEVKGTSSLKAGDVSGKLTPAAGTTVEVKGEDATAVTTLAGTISATGSYGNVKLDNSAAVEIAKTATVTVDGKLTMGGANNITVKGTLRINGEVDKAVLAKLTGDSNDAGKVIFGSNVKITDASTTSLTNFKNASGNNAAEFAGLTFTWDKTDSFDTTAAAATYTVALPRVINSTSTGKEGAYTVALDNADGKYAAGATVTLTVTCTKAPGAGTTDTVTVSTVKGGAVTSGTLTFTTTGNKSATFTMPAEDVRDLEVRVSNAATYSTNVPADVAADGTKGAYTATITKTTGLAGGAEVTVSIECTTAPKAGTTDTVTVTGAGISNATSQDFTATDTKSVTFKMPAAADVTDLAISVSSNAAATRTLTLPANVSASWSAGNAASGITAGSIDAGGNGAVPEGATVALGGTAFVTTSYLKVGSDYLVKSGTETFTMPSSDLEIAATKYHKIAVTEAVTIEATNSSSATAVATLDGSEYVAEDATVAVNITIKDNTLTGVANGVSATIAATGATKDSQTPAADAKLFDQNTTANTAKTVTVNFSAWSAADVDLTVTLKNMA